MNIVLLQASIRDSIWQFTAFDHDLWYKTFLYFMSPVVSVVAYCSNHILDTYPPLYVSDILCSAI